MRIGVYGASGRIGTRLVEAILARPGLELAAAHVSSTSQWRGRPVGGTLIEYRPAEAAVNAHSDVIIDFSTPEASLELQEIAGDRAVPVVIGTTGFSSEQRTKLVAAAKRRPIMLGANFALGFDAFAEAVFRFAERHPDALATIDETYHQRKKRVASGTSLQLASGIRAARTQPGGSAAPDIPIRIHRRADTIGINRVQFDLGVSSVEFGFTVATLHAYAEGALRGAIWLARPGLSPGLYVPSESK